MKRPERWHIPETAVGIAVILAGIALGTTIGLAIGTILTNW